MMFAPVIAGAAESTLTDETEEQKVRRYHGMVVNVGRMKRM